MPSHISLLPRLRDHYKRRGKIVNARSGGGLLRRDNGRTVVHRNSFDCMHKIAAEKRSHGLRKRLVTPCSS